MVKQQILMMLSLYLDFSFPLCQDSSENLKVVVLRRGRQPLAMQTHHRGPTLYGLEETQGRQELASALAFPVGARGWEGQWVLLTVRTVGLAGFINRLVP